MKETTEEQIYASQQKKIKLFEKFCSAFVIWTQINLDLQATGYHFCFTLIEKKLELLNRDVLLMQYL